MGFQPQFNRLDAVIFVKQQFGYGGDICRKARRSTCDSIPLFDNGTTWVDQGMTSFTAYDIPSDTGASERLEYAVSVPCQPPKKLCVFSNVILARAILSWNDQPSRTRRISCRYGVRFPTPICRSTLLPAEGMGAFELSRSSCPRSSGRCWTSIRSLPTLKPKQLGVAELHALYRGKEVEPHRYAMAEVKQLIKGPALTGILQVGDLPGRIGRAGPQAR